MTVFLNLFSLSAAGFSIAASMLLLFQKRAESRTAKYFSSLLLVVLIVIQLFHVSIITQFISMEQNHFLQVITFCYLCSLGLVGPAFYLYCQCILYSDKEWAVQDLVHFLPVTIISSLGFFFTEYFNALYSLLFLLGGLYMGMLAALIFRLRERRTLFKMEFAFTVIFLGWSAAIVFVGFFSSQTIELLIPVQTIMLSLSVAGAIYIQLNYPHLLSSLEEISNRQYQTSTLLNIDCDATKEKLEQLMSDRKVYQDNELSLSLTAEMLSLKAHQLSELINTQLNMSFSSYLRLQRVKAAEKLLLMEPTVSVLAVGLSVGFSSQSAFYSAFKEVHELAPGQYRRIKLAE